ncbi:MAG: hypothetical protein GY866_33830 [Proteobacteria bacterium]|nr:hypothetical protein [Pseudomonadota bacterium]
MRYPSYLEDPFAFPDFFKIRVGYPRPRIEHLAESVQSELEMQFRKTPLQPGAKVGVGVGSRGIRNIAVIVKLVCEEIKRKGAIPFVIPAMGSHGGATSEGQTSVLKTLGITEEVCGCRIVSSLKVERIGIVFSEVPVYYSSDALRMDHSICINRIKPHTKFKSPVESGVLKMLCIGMGKHEGALAYHKWALKYGFYPLLKEIGKETIGKSNFIFGIGIVENAYDETMTLEGLDHRELIAREEELLTIAKENMPRLPVRNADVLVVRQIGKDISGAGMDPNVTGRAGDLMEDDFSSVFKATRLAVLNLSEASKGNGLGIGNADIITGKIFEALDYEATLMNILTGISLKKAAIPVVMPTDEKAIQACFTTIGPLPPEQVRAIIIRDTLDIAECWASSALYDDLQSNPQIDIVEKVELEFDGDGNLILE